MAWKRKGKKFNWQQYGHVATTGDGKQYNRFTRFFNGSILRCEQRAASAKTRSKNRRKHKYKWNLCGRGRKSVSGQSKRYYSLCDVISVQSILNIECILIVVRRTQFDFHSEERCVCVCEKAWTAKHTYARFSGMYDDWMGAQRVLCARLCET